MKGDGHNSMLDSELAKQVRAALRAHALTKNATIKVLDENGFVTLMGATSSEAAREMAEEITLQQPGVRKVLNKLEVQGFDRSMPSPQRLPSDEYPSVES